MIFSLTHPGNTVLERKVPPWKIRRIARYPRGSRGLILGEPGGRRADLPGGEAGENPGITANRRNNKNFGEIVGPPGEGVKPFQITWPIYALTVTCSEGHPSHPGGHALLPGRPPSAGSFQPEALTALPVPPYPRGGGRGGRPGSRASAPGRSPGEFHASPAVYWQPDSVRAGTTVTAGRREGPTTETPGTSPGLPPALPGVPAASLRVSPGTRAVPAYSRGGGRAD